MKKLLLLSLLLLILFVEGQSQEKTSGISLCNKAVTNNEFNTISTTLDKLIECPEITYNKDDNWVVTSFRLAKQTSEGYSVINEKVSGNIITKDILELLKNEKNLKKLEIQNYTVKDEKGNLKRMNARRDAFIVFITE